MLIAAFASVADEAMAIVVNLMSVVSLTEPLTPALPVEGLSAWISTTGRVIPGTTPRGIGRGAF